MLIAKLLAFISAMPTAFMDEINYCVPWVKTHGYHVGHADGILK